MIVRQRYQVPTRTIDHTFDQLTRSFFDGRSSGPAMKANWINDHYVLTADLPGVSADNVHVNVVGDKLHLVVNSDEFGTDRSLKMHSQLDPNKVSANYADGRLTVTIGKVDTPEPRAIELDLSAPVIEAAASEVSADEVDTNASANTHEGSPIE